MYLILNINNINNNYFCLGRGEFIEHAVFAGNMYGTSKAAVELVRSKGILDLISFCLLFLKWQARLE